MSRRCKAGCRARIIVGWNTGKIVLVVRRYFGEKVSDATWPQPIFPWVVTGLTGPLRHVMLETGIECQPSMTIVVDDRDLEPLDDDNSGFEAGEEREKQRRTSSTAQ